MRPEPSDPGRARRSRASQGGHYLAAWSGSVGRESMVAGAVVSARLLRRARDRRCDRSLGWFGAITWSGLLWWLIVIGLVTLVPLYGIDLAVPAEARSDTCSLDYGGPAPDGFWIFSGTQRLLNTALFVPGRSAAGAGRRALADRVGDGAAGAARCSAATRWRSSCSSSRSRGSTAPATSPTSSTT